MAEISRAMFRAGQLGIWRIDQISAVVGDSLPDADRLGVLVAPPIFIPPRDAAAWELQGTTSNTRYTEHVEQGRLFAVQEGLGRPIATCAALIPIRKSKTWWTLAQDERRAIFEEQSHHIAVGLDYLPAIARRLYHCRELGEPFDFLTWFEYAPEHQSMFEGLVARLRATPEWQFVDREVDIRLTLEAEV